MKIAVTDGKYVVNNFFYLTITPDNDNTPTITASDISVDISEVTQVGSQITRFTVVDFDDVVNQFDFSASSVEFTLTSVTSSDITIGKDSSTDLKLS